MGHSLALSKEYINFLHHHCSPLSLGLGIYKNIEQVIVPLTCRADAGMCRVGTGAEAPCLLLLSFRPVSWAVKLQYAYTQFFDHVSYAAGVVQ